MLGKDLCQNFSCIYILALNIVVRNRGEKNRGDNCRDVFDLHYTITQILLLNIFITLFKLFTFDIDLLSKQVSQKNCFNNLMGNN